MLAVIEEEFLADSNVVKGVHADPRSHVAEHDRGLSVARSSRTDSPGVVDESHLVADVV